MTDCCNTTIDAPPPLPVVHYYCGGIGRAVCGEMLTLDKKGPCFSTHFPDTTCEACRRSTPALAAAPSSPEPGTRAEHEWVAVAKGPARCRRCDRYETEKNLPASCASAPSSSHGAGEEEGLRATLVEVDEVLTEMGWHTDRGLLLRVRTALSGRADATKGGT